ncbi:MAG TPA: M20/M25/M40 family metallo-hydrolase, partial [Solirubrobacteraceae bacterium]|nr:M20/M25/M40 family metallo-hydrolase [Solirubrobacteraceae bacterium]
MTAGHAATSYLARLIAAESTPGGERAIIELVGQEMRSLGYRDVHVDGAGNAVGSIGSGFPTVLVDCHVDTIPLHAAEAWTHDPFGAEVSQGRMYGLGACDMKASVAAATHGLIELRALPPGSGTVVLVCSVAEEMMEGAALLEAVEAARPDLVVIGEPTDLAVNRGQRGRAKLDLTVRGHGAHAANRADAANAVEAMAAILAELAAGQRTSPDSELAFS